MGALPDVVSLTAVSAVAVWRMATSPVMMVPSSAAPIWRPKVRNSGIAPGVPMPKVMTWLKLLIVV